MRFWFWVAILSGVFTIEWAREWHQPTGALNTKSGIVMDDPFPAPTPRP